MTLLDSKSMALKECAIWQLCFQLILDLQKKIKKSKSFISLTKLLLMLISFIIICNDQNHEINIGMI